uniref:NADH dehydrogenase subunit 4L n=1 Tax=Botryllus schlosseri TaxID=30301 RepID=A0A024GWF9_BOTSH|nr:NADH dehydrogenase subunit 4L [Botryllus schlosseri]
MFLFVTIVIFFFLFFFLKFELMLLLVALELIFMLLIFCVISSGGSLWLGLILLSVSVCEGVLGVTFLVSLNMYSMGTVMK